MEITEIKKIGKGQRYSLKVDEIFQGVFEAEILARHNLKTGQEIEEDFLNSLKIENGNYACFDRALNLLEHGMKSQKQVQDYLKGKGYPESCIEKAVEKLAEYGYLNDLAYACEYVRLYSQKDGEKKLRFALKNKGVEDELIDQAIEQCLTDESQEEVCFKLAAKKIKNAELDIKIRQKVTAYLAGRGFSFETINRALTRLKEER